MLASLGVITTKRLLRESVASDGALYHIDVDGTYKYKLVINGSPAFGLIGVGLGSSSVGYTLDEPMVILDSISGSPLSV